MFFILKNVAKNIISIVNVMQVQTTNKATCSIIANNY